MNSMFGEWYRQAEIEPKPGELEERWKAVESLKSKSDTEYAANLVRLHFSLAGLPDDFTGDFRKVFFDIDSTFRMAGNENEVRVLAGAVLVEMIQRNDAHADGVALVVLAAAFPELRKKAPLEDLLKTAQKHIFDRGIAVRNVAAKGKVALADVETTLNTLKTNIAAGTAPPWADIEVLLRALSDNITKVNQNVDARLISSQRQHDVLLEESNIVWWLFGGAVRDSQRQYSGLSAAEAALTAAKDLSSLIHVIPPPIASPVYLERALGDHVDTSITLEQVGGVAEFRGVAPNATLFPLKNCFASVDGGKTAKVAATAAAKMFQLRAGGVIEAKVVSLQFFRESLAERFLHKKG
jgi:hypothetical protein